MPFQFLENFSGKWPWCHLLDSSDNSSPFQENTNAFLMWEWQHVGATMVHMHLYEHSS